MAQESVHDTVHAKMILMADHPSGFVSTGTKKIPSGALMVSGAVLHIHQPNQWIAV